MFDDELVCNLKDCVVVYEDCVHICLPDIPTIILSDEELDHLFFNPEDTMSASDDYYKGVFWNDLFAYAYRIRENKRVMYEELGFCKF